MSKTIAVVIAVLIVGGGAYYLLSKNSSSRTPVQTPPPATTAEPAAPASNTSETSASAVVSIQNFSFSPATLSVKTGTTVTWTNNDSVTHTVTPDSAGPFGSQTLAPGHSFSFTFTASGSMPYHCAIHPMMKGSIAVTD